jgi:hypothetical protein
MAGLEVGLTQAISRPGTRRKPHSALVKTLNQTLTTGVCVKDEVHTHCFAIRRLRVSASRVFLLPGVVSVSQRTLPSRKALCLTSHARAVRCFALLSLALLVPPTPAPAPRPTRAPVARWVECAVLAVRFFAWALFCRVRLRSAEHSLPRLCSLALAAAPSCCCIVVCLCFEVRFCLRCSRE